MKESAPFSDSAFCGKCFSKLKKTLKESHERTKSHRVIAFDVVIRQYFAYGIVVKLQFVDKRKAHKHALQSGDP
ncbi:hypothetical protein SDC9_206792 [bioreactor metagenome]|uniref:Uncharacterized protein n=1 Tax=bioreactor metagenome TaxID=1076179 RepID=A0A645JFF1_9ZZZZ